MKAYATIDEARMAQGRRLDAQVPGCPLRCWPAIVHGPEGGYMIVDLGFAERNDLEELR